MESMQAFVGCFSGKPSPFIALVKAAGLSSAHQTDAMIV
uniref:Uncharacterized protein n=1 Tax=Klebsiella pneumoniae TaxID=573 RepID=A0A6G9HT62_KLEPN|nr:hypothetical protein [Klebsiella pneumoniae]